MLETQDEFLSALRDVIDDYEACRDRGACSATSPSVSPRSLLTPQANAAPVSPGDMSLCDLLVPNPQVGWQYPYFFTGLNWTISDGASHQAGLEIVWDLYHRQVAGFTFTGHGLSTLLGAEATVYGGYAFGKKADVIDAWSGEFIGVTGSAGVPFLELEGGATAFAAPDKSVVGAALIFTVGIDFFPASVSGYFGHAYGTALDEGTQALTRNFTGVKFTTESTKAKVYVPQARIQGRSFVQFRSGRDMALGLLQTYGIAVVIPAAHVLALEIQQRKNVSVEQLCPDGATHPLRFVSPGPARGKGKIGR